MDLSQEELKILLIEAEQAHANYEKQSRQLDHDWASWYATYIINKLKQNHY